MPQILPFKGIYYNQKKIKDLSSVISPPYDEIQTVAQHKMYLDRSKYNIVHLDKGDEPSDGHPEPARYLKAARSYKLWKKKGILKTSLSDAYYYLKIEYIYRGKIYKRFGFLGILELTPFSQNQVFPHEETSPLPKQDRLSLLQACGVNFSPIFVLYADKKKFINHIMQKEIKKKIPLMEVVDDDEVKYTVWSINNPNILSLMKNYISNYKIIIADGHHRYETSLYFSQIVKKKEKNIGQFSSANFILAYFTNIEEPHITIFPHHRLIKLPHISSTDIENEIKKYFDIEIINLGNFGGKILENVLKKMEKKTKERTTLGMYLGNNKFYFLSLKPNIDLTQIIKTDKPKTWIRLEVNVMEELVISKILGLKTNKNTLNNAVYYTKCPQIAIKLVQENRYQVAFFLNPPDIHKVKEMALAGIRLPQKSTYFYPKLPSGLIMYEMSRLPKAKRVSLRKASSNS